MQGRSLRMFSYLAVDVRTSIYLFTSPTRSGPSSQIVNRLLAFRESLQPANQTWLMLNSATRFQRFWRISFSPDIV
jgi:hypothetical protein